MIGYPFPPLLNVVKTSRGKNRMDKQASDKQMLQFSNFPQFIVANAAYNLTWLRALANEKEQDNEMGLGITKL